MKRLILTLLTVATLAVVAVVLIGPGTEASPDITITVNSTDDTDNRNDELTLREAMKLATGGLEVGELTPGECFRVSGAIWVLPSGPCGSNNPPGAASADTIVFDPSVFPLGSPGTISLGGGLPALWWGDDTVDASSAGVIVDGLDKSFECFSLGVGDGNTIKGLEIYNCAIAVMVTGDATTIGGTSSAERNVISGNALGIRINYSDDNVVQGNYIGTNAAGDGALPNDNGVKIDYEGERNTVGGVNPGEGNTIAFNTQHGVVVDGSLDEISPGPPYTERNSIRGNSIHSNGGKGIENSEGGNTELQPPTVDTAGSVSGTACPNCTIDVYSDEEDEGRVYEGSTTADGAGNWSFSGSPQGPNVTATATDSDGNTSEFSAPLEPPWPTPTSTATPASTPSPTPPVGPTRSLFWGPGWHNDSWSGPDNTVPQDALACASGKYAAAYRFTDAGLERYFPDRPDISNMGPLNKYDAFLILVSVPVSCTMPVAP